MIEKPELARAVREHHSALYRAAHLVAWGLSGESSGRYVERLRDEVLDALEDGVFSAELPTRKEFEEAGVEAEAWEMAEHLLDVARNGAERGVA